MTNFQTQMDVFEILYKFLHKQLWISSCLILWMERIPAPVNICKYPIIYRVLYIPGGWEWDFWTNNSSSVKLWKFGNLRWLKRHLHQSSFRTGPQQPPVCAVLD